MGGRGRGSPQPSSAGGGQMPEFLQGHVGEGKYNIGIMGLSGVGKSSLLEAVLGEDLVVGSTEATTEPTRFQLPLTDPRGYFGNFVKRLPMLHQDCVRAKLTDVNVWDLPGAGTCSHPAATYVKDKGLEWFDYVVMLVGERVREDDIAFLGKLMSTKCLVARSKMDATLSPFLLREEKRIGRELSGDEKIGLGQEEFDKIRGDMVQEIAKVVADFNQLYLVIAPDAIDKRGIAGEVASKLNELQLAIDRMFLSIILDRHGHDLSCYFDQSLYGQAGMTVWNWTYDFIRSFKEHRAPNVSGATCPRTFETSQYKTLYHDDQANVSPRNLGEVQSVFYAFIKRYFEGQKKTLESAHVFAREIIKDVNCKNHHIIERDAPLPGGIDYVQMIAGQVWSSDQKVGHDKEFCSCLNQVLREDDGPALQPAVRISAWLNRLCVTERGSVNPLPWPEQYTTYRGTYMPSSALEFFRQGLEYRASMFLATSYEERVARNFLRISERANEGKQAVQFNFELDRVNMCDHANFIEFVSCVPGEHELLYTAYSAFKVLEAGAPKPTPRWDDPVIVRLHVFPDNRAVPEDVPVPAWH